jgi:hypothetical protein
VSDDGRTLMFTSSASPAGYDNAGHVELYVYRWGSSGGRLTCASCNPSGAPATSDAWLWMHEQGVEGFGTLQPFTPEQTPRFMSADGGRVFFESEEQLVRQDANGEMNVYEWEQEDVGSCPAGRSEGCLFLMSSGTSSEPSWFAGASATGEDVFFFTRQPLVGQDTDQLVDLYDARVDGGLTAQNPSAAVAPCLAEACRAAQAPAPAVGVPVSQVFSGPGDLAPTGESKPAAKPTAKSAECKKGYVKKKNKCVRSRKGRKKAKKSNRRGR